MSQQSVRQVARREVMEAAATRRRERAEQEKRLEDLGVQVAAALMERDAAVVAAERRAGLGLRTMTEDEGLGVQDALAWCGGPVTVREAKRLMRGAGTTGEVAQLGQAVTDGEVAGEPAAGARGAPDHVGVTADDGGGRPVASSAPAAVVP